MTIAGLASLGLALPNLTTSYHSFNHQLKNMNIIDLYHALGQVEGISPTL
jgi:hypothetical protein